MEFGQGKDGQAIDMRCLADFAKGAYFAACDAVKPVKIVEAVKDCLFMALFGVAPMNSAGLRR